MARNSYALEQRPAIAFAMVPTGGLVCSRRVCPTDGALAFFATPVNRWQRRRGFARPPQMEWRCPVCGHVAPDLTPEERLEPLPSAGPNQRRAPMAS